MNSINDNKVGKISLEGEDKNKLLNLLIKYKYKVPGIFLIFDNITTDFNLFYRSECIKGNDSKENIINKLEIQLNKTTLNTKLKDYSINTIINDYYLYFITRNNSLESRTKDLSQLIKIFEEICNMKFNYQKKNEKDLNTKDFLELLIWSNIYNLELNEFLYCIQYFKEIKLFEKTNIYNEVLKTIKIYDKENLENGEKDKNNINQINAKIEDKYVLKKFMSILITIFNEKCLQNPKYIKKARDIMPSMYNLNERKKLCCKELYTFIEICSIYDALEMKKLIMKKNLAKK